MLILLIISQALRFLLYIFFKIFVGHMSIFGAPLGFKARVGSALFELCRGIHDIHSLRFTPGATPLPVYIASIAASHFPHIRVSAEVGCRI